MSSWTENAGKSGAGSEMVGLEADFVSRPWEGCHRGTSEKIWESATEAAVRVS